MQFSKAVNTGCRRPRAGLAEDRRQARRRGAGAQPSILTPPLTAPSCWPLPALPGFAFFHCYLRLLPQAQNDLHIRGYLGSQTRVRHSQLSSQPGCFLPFLPLILSRASQKEPILSPLSPPVFPPKVFPVVFMCFPAKVNKPPRQPCRLRNAQTWSALRAPVLGHHHTGSFSCCNNKPGARWLDNTTVVSYRSERQCLARTASSLAEASSQCPHVEAGAGSSRVASGRHRSHHEALSSWASQPTPSQQG